MSATRAVSVSVNGMVLDRWTSVAINRDLGEICGSFELTLRDDARSLAAWPYGTPGQIGPLLLSQPVEISVYGEVVLRGWVEAVEPSYQEGDASLTIAGRDIAGDLVDCTAGPEGPVEFKGLRLEEFAERLCAPFGIGVRCDVDTGEPFDKISVDVTETVLSAVEKYARQRAVLVTSDGIADLVLTRSGQTRAAADITGPGPGVLMVRGQFSATDRFSDYYVKGQAPRAGGQRASAAPMTAGSLPAVRGDEAARYRAANGGGQIKTKKAAGLPTREAAGVTVLGHARDTEITRYRPMVTLLKASGRDADAQSQADWMARVHRARGDNLVIALQGWRAGGALWQPNCLTRVTDRFMMVDRDYLIAGVRYGYGDGEGEVAELRVTGPEAYDPEADDAAA